MPAPRTLPSFARQVILAFSKPGDLVFDPFMGGGTTLVEARALGRRAAGTDISSLAVFLTETKPSVFSPAELRRVQSWAKRYIPKINSHAPAARQGDWEDSGYHRNIDGRKTWAVRKMLQVLAVGHVSLQAGEPPCHLRRKLDSYIVRTDGQDFVEYIRIAAGDLGHRQI